MKTAGDGTTRGAIDAPVLAEMLDRQAPVKVIDVRTPGEFERAHIPGAYNVPLDTLGEHRDELARHLDDPVVLVCASGARAARADARLAEAGLDNVHVLAGGMGAWERLGGAIEQVRARWTLERQVRLIAGGVVLGAVLTSLAVPRAKWVAGAVGAGLTFAALTDTCAMGTVLAKLPYNRGASCDIDRVVAQLADRRPTP